MARVVGKFIPGKFEKCIKCGHLHGRGMPVAVDDDNKQQVQVWCYDCCLHLPGFAQWDKVRPTKIWEKTR